MAKLTLTDLTSLTNEQSAISTINANNTRIETALELTLSRNGLTPNQMTDNLDMNSFRILNIAAPIDDNDLVRLSDIKDGIKGDKGDQGPSGGPITDGDYGDIVATVGGTVLTIDATVLPAYGRTLIANTTAADARTDLALGDSAILNVGKIAGTVTAGNDSRIFSYVVTSVSSDVTVQASQTITPTILYHAPSDSARNITIDNVGAQNYPAGSMITIYNHPSAGAVTLIRGGSVEMYCNGAITSSDMTLAPGGFCSAVQISTNLWLVTGTGLTVI